MLSARAKSVSGKQALANADVKYPGYAMNVGESVIVAGQG